jgi:hypothetical protein
MRAADPMRCRPPGGEIRKSTAGKVGDKTDVGEASSSDEVGILTGG